MIRHAKAVVVVSALLLTLLLVGASFALALQTHTKGDDLDPVPTGAFAFQGLTVDQSGGDLYAVDQFDPNTFAHGMLHRFHSDGSYDEAFATATASFSESLNQPQDVAVDNTGGSTDGRIYVADSANNRVLAIDSTWAPVAGFGTAGQINGAEDSPGDPDTVPAGGFSNPCGVAVDQTTANLFVADQFNNRIWIFDSSGAYLARLQDSSLNGPCGLAFDSTSSSLYVRNANDGKVLRFARTSATDYGFSSVLYGADDGGFASDVAVDSSSDDVYVNRGDRIAHYEQFGGLVSTFGQGQLCCSGGIAIDSANGRVYASDGNAIRTFSTALTTLPDATTGSASNVSGESATVKGTVDPAGGPEAECSFEYDTDGSYSAPAPVPCEPVGPYAGFQAVSADLTGLSPATTYHYRLHATSAEGESNGADMTFTTDGPPIVSSFWVSDVGSSSARLRAQIDPSGAATTYRFEYVIEAEFEANGFANAIGVPDPDGALATTNAAEPVSETITGLSPETSYRFRVVATNAIDTTESPAKAFETFAPAASPDRGDLPGQGFLPHDRAWELVSPPDKLGNDVSAHTFRIHAAADGSAVSFSSLGGFADVAGTAIETEYIAERTAAPATNGWATHGVTPRQEPLSFAFVASAVRSGYQGELSDDLSSGVYRAWSPVTDAPNVAEQYANLYVREDLRTPGAGSYKLISDAVAPLTPPDVINGPFPTPQYFAGASDDFQQVIFEAKRPLSADAKGEDTLFEENVKLYKHAAPSVPRLVAAGPNCPGGNGFFPDKPCSAAGVGASNRNYTEEAISADGSRVEFTAPVNAAFGFRTNKPGAHSRVFQLDDQGTLTTADDATIQLNASEASSPQLTSGAEFQTASRDGDRVFFTSGEQLTDEPSGGLYLWERQGESEVQQLSLDATAGSFGLTAHSQPTRGRGNLVNGSEVVSEVSAGSFMVGQSVSGPGIAPGTRIVAMAPNLDLTLSQPATADLAEAEIAANVEATTPPLPFDASAEEVESALEALTDEASTGETSRPLIGEGNVEVSGAPGGPYEIAFTGALQGVNVLELGAEDSGLSGGGASATVGTVDPVQNLTLLAANDVINAIGASEDGHRLYFTASAQLVPGGPPVNESGIYHWQDADGTPGGTLSFVGGVSASAATAINGEEGFARAQVGRVTPDGHHLLFQASTGEELAPEYEHGQCDGEDPLVSSSASCAQVYVYRGESSTPLKPDVVCASCNPSGAPGTAHAWLQRVADAGYAAVTTHLSHALSDDGRYAFFSTAEKLVPEDSNGLEDAYVYDTAAEEPRLLSSGESPSPSYFADASASGRDAFFLTYEQLSGWDTDTNNDVYDARAGGGLPEPPPAPPACQGDACQPAPNQLSDPTPASSSFAGAGNQKQRARLRCRKGQRKVKARKGKARCVKRHAKQNRKRATGKNGRAGR